MEQYSREDFLGKIRTKYPIYMDIDDSTLYNAVMKKYPIYKQYIIPEKPVEKEEWYPKIMPTLAELIPKREVAPAITTEVKPEKFVSPKQLQDIARIGTIVPREVEIDPEYFTTLSQAKYISARIFSGVVEAPAWAMTELAVKGIRTIFSKESRPYQYLTKFVEYYSQPEKYGLVTPFATRARAQYRGANYQQSYALGILGDMAEMGADLGMYLTQLALIGKISPASSIAKTPNVRMLKHIKKIGTHGFLTTEGDVADRLKASVYRIAYNITPYIANATGLAGIQTVTIDTMLNTFLTSPTYVKAYKESGGINKEFLAMALPQFVMDIGMALSTRGLPEKQFKQRISKYIKGRPELAKLPKEEAYQLIKNLQENITGLEQTPISRLLEPVEKLPLKPKLEPVAKEKVEVGVKSPVKEKVASVFPEKPPEVKKEVKPKPIIKKEEVGKEVAPKEIPKIKTPTEIYYRDYKKINEWLDKHLKFKKINKDILPPEINDIVQKTYEKAVKDYVAGAKDKPVFGLFQGRMKAKISDILKAQKKPEKLVEKMVVEKMTPEKALETKELRTQIDTAIKSLKLSKRDELIFKQVKGLDETGKTKTFRVVADKNNLTAERVRQIVENIESRLKKHRELLYAGLPVRKIVRQITKPFRNIFLKAVQPTKILTEKLGIVGERLTARAIRFHHYPAYMRLRINQKQFNNIDKNVEQLEEFFHEYSQKDLKNFMVAFRSPAQTPVGKKAQSEALIKIPISLRDSDFMKQIQELADVVNKYRNLVFKDLELQYFEDYFYGLYKKTNKSKIFFREHRSHTLRFLKQKTIPTPADATGIGLELVNWNPITNLKQELSHIAYYKSLIDLRTGFEKDRNKDLFMTNVLPPTLGRLARASTDLDSFKEHSFKELGKEKFRGHINKWYREQPFYDKEDKFDKRLKKFFELSKEIGEKTKLGWTHIEERLFEKYLFEPSLARVINSLISVNKVTRTLPLNILRKVNRIIQFGKFLGSTFHQQNVSVQSIVDTRITDMLKKEGGFVSIAKSFKGLKPELKKTDLYKDYVSMGGSSERSLQAESRKVIHNALKQIDLYNIKRLSKEGKGIKALFGASLHYSIGLLPKYVDWLFGEYIPALKFHKYAYENNKKRIELGRELTDYEKLEIIKEGQNFYGMMNESLFGRSGTMTSVLRLLYLAPGYAEGNMRTIWKSVAQGNTSFEELIKGQGSRSRRALIQSLLLKLILATTGTLMLTGKKPKEPENINDIRDLWRINTGLTDKDNMPVMIDMLTYDRDYWNILVDPIIKGKPQNVTKALVKRLRGMTAPSARIIYDLVGFALGKQVVDWKNDNVVDVTDTTLQQMFQLLAYETGIATTPIMAGIYRRAKEKEVPTEYALPFVMLGLRVTRDEKWNEKKEIISKMYQLKDKQDKLYRYLKKLGRKPYDEIKKYNKKIDDWFNSKTVKLHLGRKESILTKADIKAMKDKLTIVPEKRLANELGRLTKPSATEEDIREAKKYLANFGIETIEDAREILNDYFNYQGIKNRRVIMKRIYRLKKAFKKD